MEIYDDDVNDHICHHNNIFDDDVEGAADRFWGSLWSGKYNSSRMEVRVVRSSESALVDQM